MYHCSLALRYFTSIDPLVSLTRLQCYGKPGFVVQILGPARLRPKQPTDPDAAQTGNYPDRRQWPENSRRLEFRRRPVSFRENFRNGTIRDNFDIRRFRFRKPSPRKCRAPDSRKRSDQLRLRVWWRHCREGSVLTRPALRNCSAGAARPTESVPHSPEQCRSRTCRHRRIRPDSTGNVYSSLKRGPY